MNSHLAHQGDGSSGHIPVLLDEVVSLLAASPGETLLDCTLGRGGHAAAIGSSAADITVAGMDLDETNREAASKRLAALSIPHQTVQGNFVRAPEFLKQTGLAADMVLADLGFASNQVDDATRGFSFIDDGPLDMRLDPGSTTTAASLIASISERDLAEIITQHGEEPFAARIAQKIASERARRPIESTGQLAALVREAYGVRARTSRQHPATRTFQAIRIAVNDEMAALQTLLDRLTRALRTGDVAWLRPGARIGIIAFHSLEDRPVKRCFASLVREGLAVDVSSGAVQARQEELNRNPRCRSARLRVIRSTID